MKVTGRATDTTNCKGATGEVARVRVVVGVEKNKQCSFVFARRLGKSRPCAKPAYRKAIGTSTFTFDRAAAKLPKGRYVVFARAVDKTGNRQVKPALRRERATP